MGWEAEVYNAGKTTIAELANQLGLDVGDRICYLFDYGDEWQFYGILKEITDDEPSGRRPEVVKEKGDPVDQYSLDDHPRYQ
ncbi:plasmid pRiA4b ORF-3 family protein [Natronobiforma cellulositropha]|uniref:plasmid pRiA4b ORF-3 family protein n=1 Tax=Natronobiforma cellulositropha TaxID=1679076 RepID=UPI0021D59080|nr:plasmid pRiA4b ORF-3 family protein [Natronobiforma cellulositropha]